MMRILALFNLFFLASPIVWAGVLPVGEHQGYVDDLESERYELIEEVVPIFQPQKKQSHFSLEIFDNELTKEFTQKYEDDFGRTQSERNYFEPNKYSILSYGSNQYTTSEQNFEKQRKFGEYVLRRLTEHHLDNYAKSNEGLRRVYEVKERISNAQVSIRKGYKVKIRYSFSANQVDLRLINPLDLDSRVSVFLDQPDSQGGGTYAETQVSLGYNLKPGTNVSTYYKIKDGVLTLVAKRKINSEVTASITGLTHTKDEGVSIRERALLFGVSWIY